MKRKQKKIIPLRKVGYVILIIIKFGELLLWISLNFRVQSKHWEVGWKNSAASRFFNQLLSVWTSVASTHFSDDFNSLSWYWTSDASEAVPRFFNQLLSVWTFDETLFLVFDISQQTLKINNINQQTKLDETCEVILIWSFRYRRLLVLEKELLHKTSY